jgi:hypothetical protein
MYSGRVEVVSEECFRPGKCLREPVRLDCLEGDMAERLKPTLA